MNECKGCINDKKHPDMVEVMEYCNYCKRAYAGVDRDYHSDKYEIEVTDGRYIFIPCKAEG